MANPVNNPVAAINDYLFGPVSTSYCIWFYILSLFAFVYFIFNLAVAFVAMLFKKVHYAFPTGLFMVAIVWFYFYFNNRLLYNMCLRSEK